MKMRTQQENREFRTAIYLRLSKDDEGAGESSSITNQRSILQEYARVHGFVVLQEYVDDGYSGTNFDRPGFRRMRADIEAGRINCVMTKDLSRLGRNSAVITSLLDEYFPERKVRYISVIDGYDSYNLSSGVSMSATMMAVVHELYARDTSAKIKSSFQAKMEQGEYIASFPPYGYKKDVEHGNKNRLVVDREVAPVVQLIFQMAAEGQRPGKIAEYLNSNGVATPAMYRCKKRPYLRVEDYTRRKEWTSQIICKMLRNEVYLGKTAQGKTRKLSFKSKVSQPIPRSEWIVVEGTHEPIITEETFRMVRSRSVARRNPPTKGFESVFSGIAKCADCGRNMTLAPSKKKGTIYNLCCNGYKSYGARECSNHFIDYNLLYNAVLQEIRKLVALNEDEKAQILTELEREEAERSQIMYASREQAYTSLEERMTRVVQSLKKLHEQYSCGEISKTVYTKLSEEYTMDLESLEKSKSSLEESAETPTKSESYRKFFQLLEEVTDVKVLSKPLLRKLIERIEVEQGRFVVGEDGKKHKEQNVRIYFRFVGNLDIEETTP